MKTQIRYKHNNKNVPYHLSEVKWAGDFYVEITSSNSVGEMEGCKSIIGKMKYSITNYYLKIQRMDNLTIKQNDPLKNVGTALFEFAFRKSFELDKEGCVELEAIGNAGAAYYKMGFRKVVPIVKYIIDIYPYLKDRTSELQAKIETHKYYNDLRKSAVLNLYFKEQTPNSLNEKKFHKTEEFQEKEKTVTFDLAIKHGIYSVYNHKVEDLLKQKDKVLSDNECDNYLTGSMSLPEENIEALKIKYCIDDPVRAIDGILGDVVHFSE